MRNQQVPLEGEELSRVLKEEYSLLLMSAVEIHEDLGSETEPFTLLKAMDTILARKDSTLFKAIGKDNKINRITLNQLARNVEEHFRTSFKQEEKKLCLVGEEHSPNENCVYSVHYERRHLFGKKGKLSRTTYLNMKYQKTDFLDCDSWEEDFQQILPQLVENGWKRFTIGSGQKDTEQLWLQQHVMDVIFKFVDNPIVTGTRQEFHNFIESWIKTVQQNSVFVFGTYCARYIDYLEYRERQNKTLAGSVDIGLFFRKGMYNIDWEKPQSMHLKNKPVSPL